MSSRVNRNTLQKILTDHEIKTGRINIPASVRDSLFPHLAENTKTAYTMIDEKGNSYDVEIKLRENRTKPEIMAKGGRRFAVTRNLLPGAILEFSRSYLPDTFYITVRAPQLTPPHLPLPSPEELQLPTGVSTQTQPPVEPHFQTVSFATAGKGFGLPVGSDHLLGRQPFSSLIIIQEELQLPPKLKADMGLKLSFGSGQLMGTDPLKPSSGGRFGPFIGSDHLLAKPPKRPSMKMELKFGSSVGQAQPLPPANKRTRLSLFDSPTPTNPELNLLIGFNTAQLQPLTKSEEQEVGWYPDLSLSLKSNFLHGPEVPYLYEAASVAGNDVQEPKPPTFLPYVFF